MATWNLLALYILMASPKKANQKNSLLRASSYEPSNRAGLVTVMNFVVCSKSEISARSTGMKSKKHDKNGGT